jgi:uncharacterized protein
MVVIHGAGSAKENHADFARLCAASGWAAVCFDQRGHGDSEDVMGPAALGDVSRIAGMLAAIEGVDPGRICVRGPATEEGLRRGLRSGELEMRADVGALDAWLAEHDLREAVRGVSPKPLILLHARGDERVPYTESERLYAEAGEPRRLIVVPGGHHRSVQHDPELQAVALGWLERELDRRP